MSEAEMRAALPKEKELLRELYALMKKDYHHPVKGTGKDIGKVYNEIYKQGYEYHSAFVAEIEKRLRIIDTKREQEQKQQGRGQNPDEQRQAKFQQSVNKNIERSQPLYRQYNMTVDANNNAAREGNTALDLVTGDDANPGFKPISEDMLEQQPQRPTTRPNISGKFNNKKSDESETKQPQQKQNEDDEFLKLMQDMQNDLNSLQ